MKKLFSERVGQPVPRVVENLNRAVCTALFQFVQQRIEDNSFGLSFPLLCQDGCGNAGCDWRAMQDNMAGYKVIWPEDARNRDDEETSDIQVFDLLEYAFEHIAQPLPDSFHSYFGHYHHGYDQEVGRRQFSEEVNRLFERNGIAFQLKEGQVERLVPSVLQEVLVQHTFNTGDQTLNELLSTARERFLNRDIRIRREALEKLWDAWERLKSLSDPSDKKMSIKLLLDKAAREPNFRERIELEARQLSEIGNNFFIRHTEVSKPHIEESGHVDYLFHRLFAMIRLLLQAHGIAI